MKLRQDFGLQMVKVLWLWTHLRKLWSSNKWFIHCKWSQDYGGKESNVVLWIRNITHILRPLNTCSSVDIFRGDSGSAALLEVCYRERALRLTTFSLLSMLRDFFFHDIISAASCLAPLLWWTFFLWKSKKKIKSLFCKLPWLWCFNTATEKDPIN